MSTRMTISKAVRRALIASAATAASLAYPTAFGQSTSGSVFGQATAGETVVVESAQTGFHREIAVGSDGAYRVPALPPGSYKVTLKHADGTTVVRDGIAVSAGTGTAVNFVAATSEGTISEVDRDRRPCREPDRRLVGRVDHDPDRRQLDKIPVARDTTSAALLAPGTVRGDAAFGTATWLRSAAPRSPRTRTYVNGFNVTNSFRNLNFSKIPFEAIAEQQVKTGGYGAEFGRSLGGVVNQTTKRGTNEFQAGGSVYWTPGVAARKTQERQSLESARAELLRHGALRSTPRKRPPSGPPTVWAGGALIKDKLFAFGLIGYSEHEEDRWGNVTQRQQHQRLTETPSWLVKLDWNINDSNAFEFTAFSDEEETDSKVFLNTLGQANRLGLVGTQFEENGGQNYVLKYTSYLTDNFTVSALYGHGEFSRGVHLTTANGLRVAYGGDLNAGHRLPGHRRRPSGRAQSGHRTYREHVQHHGHASQPRRHRPSRRRR